MEQHDDALLRLERELRRLITAEVFDEAGTVLAQYREELNRRLTSLPAGGEEQRELGRTAGQLLHWIDLMVRTSRSYFSRQLEQASHLSGYRRYERRPGVQLQA